MDPQQTPAPAPPQQPFNSGQYDFITNPGKPPKRSLFGGSNTTGLLVKLIVVFVGLIVVILIGSLFFGGKSDKEALLPVLQKQSSIVATAKLGVEDGGSTQTKAFGSSVQLATTSQQQSLITQLTKTAKLKDKEYVAGVPSSVQAQLDSAQKNGRFDEAFITAIREELTEYQQVIKTANNNVSSKTTKALLAKDYASTTTLLATPTN